MKKYANVKYFSLGLDYNEHNESYYFLQTANRNNEEDTEIICCRYKIVPVIIGLIYSFVYKKELVRW